MKTFIIIKYFLFVSLFLLPFCTTKNTIKRLDHKSLYIENNGGNFRLYHKNVNSQYILVSDSISTIITYDSVFAYSRISNIHPNMLIVNPDMFIVKVDKQGNISKRLVNGLDFEKRFPTYFRFPATTKTTYISDWYQLLGPEETIISEKNIIK